MTDVNGTVIGIQNIPVASGTPTGGEVLTYVAANSDLEYKPVSVGNVVGPLILSPNTVATPTAITALANEQLFTISTYSGGFTGIIAQLPLPGTTGAPIQFGMMTVDADVNMISESSNNMSRSKLSSQWLYNTSAIVAQQIGTQISNILASKSGWNVIIQQDGVASGYIDLLISTNGNDIVNNSALVGWTYTQAYAAHGTFTYIVSGTWTAPAGVTSITIYGFGGGGGGGAGSQYSSPSHQSCNGGGGGGASTGSTTTLSVTPGNTYLITVGTGGSGGNGYTGGGAGNNGSTGSNTTFDVLYTFSGGTGGTGGALASTGSSPTSSNGSNAGGYVGGTGGGNWPFDGSNGFGGGNGGNAGPAGNGGNGGDGVEAGSNIPVSGATNSGAGGGGSGGGTGRIGGNGGSGFLSITW